ncbi:uncharacterized protein LOC142823534 isoform X2 [Pelodiscus sinensis]|uniref:uncharacterized protein LOC142823534 isoform X2 n=1 Tax=Pelodiscus sinensis TaxID=13735 RepID=UPI003F6BEE87
MMAYHIGGCADINNYGTININMHLRAPCPIRAPGPRCIPLCASAPQRDGRSRDVASLPGSLDSTEEVGQSAVTFKPGSLYQLPADEAVQNPESTVTEILVLKPGSLCRQPADGEGGAEQRGGPDPDVHFVFTLPDEASLKAAASIMKSLSSELTLEELCERACRSGADRKAEAQRLFKQYGAGGVGWTAEDMELFLDALEGTELCKLFQEKRKGDGDPKTGCKLSQSGV